MVKTLTSMMMCDRLKKRKTRVRSSGYFFIIVVGGLRTIDKIKGVVNVYHSIRDLQLLQQEIRRFFMIHFTCLLRLTFIGIFSSFIKRKTRIGCSGSSKITNTEYNIFHVSYLPNYLQGDNHGN